MAGAFSGALSSIFYPPFSLLCLGGLGALGVLARCSICVGRASARRMFPAAVCRGVLKYALHVPYPYPRCRGLVPSAPGVEFPMRNRIGWAALLLIAAGA